MPIYCFFCKCGNKFEKALPMADSQKLQYCECGEQARRDIRTEHSQGNIDGLMADNPRYSVSGAVMDEDLPAAKKLHPHISDWKKVGSSWRPLIRNRKEKLLFMKQAKAYEY